MRWITDLRELNKPTIKDSYPLMNIQEILHSLQGASVFIPGCVRSLSCIKNRTWEPPVYSIYQPLRHIPVYIHAVWIIQHWEHVQQNDRRSHERGGQRLLNIIPGRHLDIQQRTLGSLLTFVTGCPGKYCCWNQDTTM